MSIEAENLVGKEYGRFVVISREHKGKRPYWKCMCMCGTIKVVRADSLKSGNTVSCGCYGAENRNIGPAIRARVGKKASPSTIEKLRLSHLGYKMPKSQKLAISKANKGKNIGEKNGSWNAGMSKVTYGPTWNSNLKRSVKEKYNHSCVMCKKESFFLHVHHIDYTKDNNSMSNLISLCPKCHKMIHRNRTYWFNYFKKEKTNV